eukprot:ctg_70.g28
MQHSASWREKKQKRALRSMKRFVIGSTSIPHSFIPVFSPVPPSHGSGPTRHLRLPGSGALPVRHVHTGYTPWSAPGDCRGGRDGLRQDGGVCAAAVAALGGGSVRTVRVGVDADPRAGVSDGRADGRARFGCGRAHGGGGGRYGFDAAGGRVAAGAAPFRHRHTGSTGHICGAGRVRGRDLGCLLCLVALFRAGRGRPPSGALLPKVALADRAAAAQRALHADVFGHHVAGHATGAAGAGGRYRRADRGVLFRCQRGGQQRVAVDAGHAGAPPVRVGAGPPEMRVCGVYLVVCGGRRRAGRGRDAATTTTARRGARRRCR